MKPLSAVFLGGIACLGFTLPFLAGRFWPEPAGSTTRGLVLRPGPAGLGEAQEARVALVIGNGGYPTAPLKNPLHDARTMADSLVACGFTVTELENADQGRMREAIRGLAATLAGGGVGLFYYAGHGMRVQGRNFLVPVGTDSLPTNQVAAASVDLDSVLAALGTAGNRLNILILDACLDNPFDTGSSDHRPGFTQVDAPAGTYLAFATAPGRTADDGAGADSPYTGALLRQLQVPGLKLEDVFKRARAEVLQASRQQQTPWESSSVVGDFYFRPGAALAAAPAPAAPVAALAEVAAAPAPALALASMPVPVGPGPASACPVMPLPPAPSVQLGGLQVRANAPGAQVYVDGDLQGQASPRSALDLADLPVGRVRLRGELAGCAPVELDCRIELGQWTQVTLVFHPVADTPAPSEEGDGLQPNRWPGGPRWPGPFRPVAGPPPGGPGPQARLMRGWNLPRAAPPTPRWYR